MIRRFVTFFSKQVSGLHEAAYLLATFTVVSQVLALLRDRLLAHHFGASTSLDIYYAAFRIPDVIFVSVASIVSITVLIPFLTTRLDENKEDAKRFMDGMFSAFFLFIIIVSIIIFFCIPQLTRLVFPGITDPVSRHNLIQLTRIILLSPIFLGLSNFFASITQVYKRFFVYAISPILYNTGIIAGVLFLYPHFGLPGLAWGVALGALLHLGIQIPSVWQVDFLPQFRRPDFKELRKVVSISLPRTLALSTTQLLLLFLVAIASLQAAGSIAVFNLSFNLQSVPLSVIGVSYSLAVFPTLSAFFAKGEVKRFLDAMITTARHIIFWSLPATILFIVLRAQIIRTIYGSGAFDWNSTRLTAAALALFSLSVVAQSLFLLFTRGYYAAGSTKKPLTVNLVCGGLVVLITYCLLWLFTTVPLFRYFIENILRVEDIPGTSVLMLPLAYTLGMIINVTLHWIYFEKDFGKFSQDVFPTLFHSLASSIVMGFVAYRFLNIFDDIINVQTGGGIFLQGLLSGIVGIIVAIILLKLMKNKEIEEIWKAAQKRFWKARPALPEPIEL